MYSVNKNSALVVTALLNSIVIFLEAQRQRCSHYVRDKLRGRYFDLSCHTNICRYLCVSTFLLYCKWIITSKLLSSNKNTLRDLYLLRIIPTFHIINNIIYFPFQTTLSPNITLLPGGLSLSLFC